VNDLVLGLDGDRFNVIFIYLSGYGIESNPIEERGYKVYYLSNIELINAFRPSILFRLVRILKEHRIDLLHCHVHKPTFYGVMAAKMAGTPVVLSHVHGLGRSGNFRRKLTNFLVSRKCNRIIAVADSVKEDILRNNWRMPSEKVSVLANSVDYARFADVSTCKQEARRMLGLPTDAFVFGTVGRLARTKGLTYLIEAFPIVKEEIPSAELVLLGNGPCREELERQASKIRSGDSIRFLGHRERIEQLYQAMDVFILSSVAEGMPRAILEAMAAGVPCIATQVGGIPEILPNRDVGRLVPARDADALAASMIELAKIPAGELRQVVENARDQVRRFYCHEIMRERLVNLYNAEVAQSSQDL
jgi:glycosyltransferase involved in cell wall biosynthesis